MAMARALPKSVNFNHPVFSMPLSMLVRSAPSPPGDDAGHKSSLMAAVLLALNQRVAR